MSLWWHFFVRYHLENGATVIRGHGSRIGSTLEIPEWNERVIKLIEYGEKGAIGYKKTRRVVM